MRNWIRCSGVYSNMVRVLLFLVCWLAALAQQMPQQDPLDTAIQAAWQASGAVGREQALALLQRKPVDSPRFAGWAQQVAQTYQNAEAGTLFGRAGDRLLVTPGLPRGPRRIAPASGSPHEQWQARCARGSLQPRTPGR